MLSGQYLKQVLSIRYDPERQGAERLHYHVNQDALRHLENEVFGKRMLITDRHDWSDEAILRAYRGQSHVEGAFRQLKDDDHLAVRPQYHWTDQKVHVHTFICLLGLLLARVLEYEARRQGYAQGLSALLELLATLRLAGCCALLPRRGDVRDARGRWNSPTHRHGSYFANSCRCNRRLCIRDGSQRSLFLQSVTAKSNWHL